MTTNKQAMNAGELLGQLNSQFKNDSTERDRDAQIILAHVLGHPRTWMLAHLETPLTPPQIAATTQAFDEYQAGTPLPYIIGHWEFFGLEFDITKDVLIPRPETELLVEKAISMASSLTQNKEPLQILAQAQEQLQLSHCREHARCAHPCHRYFPSLR